MANRKRRRRKNKPLYERDQPMYFGKGFEITYNDIRDIAAAINDKDREISAEVRRLVPLDLLDALDKVPTVDQELMICHQFKKMHSANFRSKQELLKKLQSSPN